MHEFDHLYITGNAGSLLPGVHVLQRLNGCEWDEKTQEVRGFFKYAYDGEDFLSLDLKTETWITQVPQAVDTKMRWDADKAEIKLHKEFLLQTCPVWLKMYLGYLKDLLQTTGKIT